MAHIEIKLAVIVGDNGEYAATKFDPEDTDWGFLADSLGIYDKARKKVDYPTRERRYIVTALVELPEIVTVVGAAIAGPAEL